MSAEITYFDGDMAKAIQEHKSQANLAQITFMNGLAEKVVDKGGYCDDKTFSAAFFGGIDPGMNWSNGVENEWLAAENPPQDFKAALKIADLIRYSHFQPFIAFSGHGFRDIDGLGVVLPGIMPVEGETGIGFKIEPSERYLGSNSYLGKIVFNGISRLRLRQHSPYEQHRIFSVTRPAESTDVTTNVADPTIFGTVAARKHLLGDCYFKQEDLVVADAQIHGVQEEAREYYDRVFSSVEVL